MIVLDCHADKEIKKGLDNYGEVLLTKPNNKILEGINSHPDLLIGKLDENTLAVDAQNIDYYSNFIKNKELIPIENIKSPYPSHIKLNYVVYKNYFIHNLKYTDKTVLNFFKSKNYEMINVKQGYTKCSVVVGKNCLITSDVGIYEKLKKFTNILLIEHKQIKLRNFEYGFIGGASGLIGDKLLFTGNLNNHSSKNKILEFLNKNNEDFEFLTQNEIVDIGTMIEI